MSESPLKGHGDMCLRDVISGITLCNCGEESSLTIQSPAERELDALRQSAGEQMAKLHEQIDQHRADKEYWWSRTMKAERREFRWILFNGFMSGLVFLGALGWWAR